MRPLPIVGIPWTWRSTMGRESHAIVRRVSCRGRLSRAWRRDRRGVALLGALVLLALSAALATATFSAARALQRAALVTRARARVEAAIPRAFAEVLAGWNGALDSLVVGGVVEVALGGERATDGPPLGRSARVKRTTERLYAVTVDVRAFGGEHPLARRRARLWLERPAGAQPAPLPNGASTPPPFVTPWAFSDLY